MNIIDGVDVSGCEYWKGYCRIASLCDYSGHLCEVTSNCYYKQLKRKEQELTHFKKENERLLQTIIKDQAEIVQKNIDETNILLMKENMDLQQQLKAKEQECEQLKKQLMQKSEVDMFFNTPIEGWSSDPCGICPHKAENEELKEQLELNTANAVVIDMAQRLYKLKATLQDIKSLCYEQNLKADFFACEVLQKISEVQDE